MLSYRADAINNNNTVTLAGARIHPNLARVLQSIGPANTLRERVHRPCQYIVQRVAAIALQETLVPRRVAWGKYTLADYMAQYHIEPEYYSIIKKGEGIISMGSTVQEVYFKACDQFAPKNHKKNIKAYPQAKPGELTITCDLHTIRPYTVCADGTPAYPDQQIEFICNVFKPIPNEAITPHIQKQLQLAAQLLTSEYTHHTYCTGSAGKVTD